MVLATIGPVRFSGKIPIALLRRLRVLKSRLTRSVPWSSTAFSESVARPAIAGRWLEGSKIDVATDNRFQFDRERILNRAEQAREKIFHVNGREVRLSEKPCMGRWDVDPVSGVRWPQGSVFAPVFEAPGDFRFPWELDRLHHLVWFGQAWRYTRDESWIVVGIGHVDEILSEAPFEHGIHWRDGLQLATRIYSLVGFADLCHDAPSWIWPPLNNAIAAHGIALSRQISPSCEITNNHVIAEVCALVLAGLYLSNLRYVKRGLRRLKTELERQIYPDGVPYEGTLPYIRFDLDFMVLLMRALEATGRSVPQWILDATRRIAVALAKLVDGKGRIPPIGDGDDARVLRLDDEPYLTVNESLHVAGSAVGMPLAPAESTGGFSFWVTGKALKPPALSEEPVWLPDSGIVHLRRGPLDVWLDCGPTGLGLNGPGGHGHNDTTAIVIHLDGVALLHDPGWYTYYGDRPMRDRLRSTVAHNTIMIDGQEQAELGGLFEILDQCKPTQTRMKRVAGDVLGVECGHSGYLRLGKGVAYRRRVLLSGTGPWRIRVTDRVRSAAPVEVVANLGSDLFWTHERPGMWNISNHRLTFRSPVSSERCLTVPCSRETGTLSEGSALRWKFIPLVFGKTEYSYVARWELVIHPDGKRKTE